MYKILAVIALWWGLFMTAEPAQAQGWTGELTITSAFVENSDLIIIATSGAHPATPGCVVNQWISSAATDERRARA